MKSSIVLHLIISLALLISSSTATNLAAEMTNATQEMQRANHFTFVTLINLAPPDMFRGGITFLMPNDKALSAADVDETSIVDFLLRHSIPSPLLIDQLANFPTGSMIPTSEPGFMFRVSNDGRRRFFLSNVRIVSPNICTRGSTIRCHGVDGVVQPTMFPQPDVPPATACNSNATSPPEAEAPSPVTTPVIMAPISSGVQVSSPKSGSNSPRGMGDAAVVIVFMLAVMKLWLQSV